MKQYYQKLLENMVKLSGMSCGVGVMCIYYGNLSGSIGWFVASGAFAYAIKLTDRLYYATKE